MSEHKSAIREDGYQSQSKKNQSVPKFVLNTEVYEQEPLDDFASITQTTQTAAAALATSSSSKRVTQSPSKHQREEATHTPENPAMDAESDHADDGAPSVRIHPRRTIKKTQTFIPGVSEFIHAEAMQAARARAASHAKKNKKQKGPSHSAADSDPGAYRGQGFTVRDHSWYDKKECTIKYAVPPIENINHHYRRISCEEACRVSGYQVSRNLIVDLEPSNVAKLNAALSSDLGETDKLVLRMCESGETNKCALFQSDPNDIDSIKVVTTKFVRSGEPVAIYMGRLVELSQFEAEYGDRAKYNLSSYEIHPDALPAEYVKRGGVPLMLDTNMYVNEAKFIRDPLWDDHEVSANVQCRIVWNQARGLPYVAMIALGNIAENVELLVNWGELAWSAHARLKLHRMAHQSHRMHFRLKQLSELIAQEGVDTYKTPHELHDTDDVPFEDFHYSWKGIGKAKKGKAKKDPEESDTVAADASSSSSQIVPLPPGIPNRYRLIPRQPDPKHSPTFILRSTPHVFDNCQVKLWKNCDYSALEPQVLAAWKAAGARFAPPISSLKPALKTVLQTGRCPKTAVYEVVSLRHPARFYSPPDCAIYSMLARSTIEKHEPIGVYVGKIFEKERFHGDYDPEDRIKQVYAYDMSTDLFDDLEEKLAKTNNSKSALKVSDLPSLVCESLSVGGNETRFINDSWCRIGGSDCKNAEALPMFNPLNGNLPVMIIRATRTIRKGEEIVTDYGETFWNKISTALCLEHSAYQAKADKQIREFEQELYEIQQRNKKSLDAELDKDEMEDSSSPSLPTKTAAPTTELPIEPPRPEECKSSVPVDAITPFLYSTPSPAAAFLPPPPDPWECLRSPYNSWDVKYSHRPYPVRFDPVKHEDTFVRNILVSQRAAIAEQYEKEKLKAKKLAAASNPTFKPRPIAKPLPPKLEGSRASSRIALINSEEGDKSQETVAEENKAQQDAVQAEERVRSARKKVLRVAESAPDIKAAPHDEVQKAQSLAKHYGKLEKKSTSEMKVPQVEDAMDETLADDLSPEIPVKEQSPADLDKMQEEQQALSSSRSIGSSSSDSDVVILDELPPSPSKQKRLRNTSKINPAPDSSFACDCGEVVASWRQLNGKPFFACRTCYMTHQQTQSSAERKRKRIGIDSDGEDDNEFAEMRGTASNDERKEDPPARMEDVGSDDMSSIPSPTLNRKIVLPRRANRRRN